MKNRVGFLTTHPIQYQVPVFREIAKQPDLDFTVYFCQIPDARIQGDGFGTSFTWDVPLLGGYQHEVLQNASAKPSVTEFGGCDTPEVYDRIRHGAFDAFVINGWHVKSCLQTLWACRKARIPCIVRGESNNLRPRAWWKRLIQRQIVRQFSACAYIGQANARFYRDLGIQNTALFPALYCVDNDRFAAAADVVDRIEARRRFQLSSDSVVFLFSGKLIDKKHPLELLGAIREAIAGGAKLECLIVGDGHLRTACESYVREHNLPVRFAGFLNQSQIVDAYVASDCLVLPSDHGETWGLVVNEAMACGRAAIVSNQVGCAEDLVTINETGEVFEFGNWSQLSKLLRDFSDQPARLRSFGAAARCRVAHYSPQAAAHGIRMAIDSVCQRTSSA